MTIIELYNILERVRHFAPVIAVWLQ